MQGAAPGGRAALCKGLLQVDVLCRARGCFRWTCYAVQGAAPGGRATALAGPSSVSSSAFVFREGLVPVTHTVQALRRTDVRMPPGDKVMVEDRVWLSLPLHISSL